MLQVERILFPTDFSDFARHALPYAVALARRYGAELHMLHVLVLHAADPADPGHEFPDLEAFYGSVERRARDRMSEEADRAGQALDVVTVRRRGISASPVILEYVEAEGIDLVVMGTHGRRGLRHALVGSVTEEVVRSAACPVLAVRGREGGPPAGRIRKIVVPVDMSEHSFLALDHARELARDHGASLAVIHVVENSIHPDVYRDHVPNATPSEEVRRTLVARLEGAEEVPMEVHVDAGNTVPTIVDFAEEQEADMVVVASHGLTGLERVLLGSVAERIVRHTSCPVLVVKAFAGGLSDTGSPRSGREGEATRSR